MKLSRIVAIALVFALPGFSPAQEKLPDGAKVTRLDVRPAKIELNGPFAYGQLLVTATLDNGETADVTRISKVEAPKFATATAGLVRPTADGNGDITVSLGGQSAKISIASFGFGENRALSYVTEVQPVLSKLGCNAGTCHGAA